MIGSAMSFRRRLLGWYDRHRRDLPWRLPVGAGPDARLDPYHVLVSEIMLQQTQVATVIPYFHRFVARFPTLKDLADAPEQEVLRLWQGLGYYSRARNLHAAARQAAASDAGDVPPDVQSLLSLPGIGRYTAGAVASIAFGHRAAVVDGNVARVLCRLDRIEADPRAPRTSQHLWRRAEELLPRRRTGDYNSAMMELGAMICTPRSPQCLLCPVRQHCHAFADGVQERIPPTRQAKPTPLLRRTTLCIQCGQRWLIEKRPDCGRWAGMWQFVTIETNGAAVTPSLLRSQFGLRAARLHRIGSVSHALTHRRYEFEVYRCEVRSHPPVQGPERQWVTLEELEQYPLPRPHVLVAAMLRQPAVLRRSRTAT